MSTLVLEADKFRLPDGRVAHGPCRPEQPPKGGRGWEIYRSMWVEEEAPEVLLSWSLRRGGPPAILALLKFEAASARIRLLEVRKDLRRQGLGSGAWEHLKHLHPEVRDWSLYAASEGAERFWRRQGWSPRHPLIPTSDLIWSPPPPEDPR